MKRMKIGMNIVVGLMILAIVCAIFFPVFSKSRSHLRDDLGSEEASEYTSLEVPQDTPSRDAIMPPGYAPPAIRKQSSTQYASETKSLLTRKIIYTAEIDLVAGDLEKARQELIRRAKFHGGYLADANISGASGSSREGTWTVRIPSDKFDQFVEEASRLGEVQSLRTRSEDVSEEFYDIRSRLTAKRVEEKRLLNHLQRSTTRLTDILAVERELSRVHSEIEQMEGRLRFLTNQTDLTTVTVTIREAKSYTPPASDAFGIQVGRTFNESIRLMVGTGKGAALVLTALLPWLLVIGLPGLLFWYHKSHRGRTKESPVVAD